MRSALVAVVLLAQADVASAASWSFSWSCSGACAKGQVDARGDEVGFPDKESCERARGEKALEINSTGSAGATTECVDAEPGQPGSRGTIGSAARAARLARAYLALDGGRGYEATYADGRTASGASQFGAQAELVFGVDAIGVGVVAGIRRDAGTPPIAASPADPMFLLDLGVGLASSPVALYSGPSLEIRPDVGAFYVWANRIGCGRCTVNLMDPRPVEPDTGHTFRLRGGLDVYWGATKEHGIALDVLFQLGTLGDLAMDADEPTSLELRPPRFLFRLSYVHRPRD